MDKIEALKLVLKDKGRKPIPKLLKELFHCLLLEKELPFYYFTSLLHKETSPDYANFIGHKKVNAIQKNIIFKNGEDSNLGNKRIFEGLLLKNNVNNTPEILAYNRGHSIIVDDDSFEVGNIDEFKELILMLISKTQTNSIFIKRNEGYGGFLAFKFDYNSIDDEEKISELFNSLSKIEFIFQETILQHKDINKIYPYSINTIRVHTYTNPATNKVEIISALMRFGSNKNIADNITSGGYFVPVDINNWTLEKFGYSFLKHGGKQYLKHPDTNFTFYGYKIPHNEKIQEAVEKVAILFDTKFVGWDIVITEEGPIIIEGNQNPHIIMAQIACKGFKNHEGFNRVFGEFI